MVFATWPADFNGKSSGFNSFPASPAVIFRSPDLHVVFAPSGKL